MAYDDHETAMDIDVDSGSPIGQERGERAGLPTAPPPRASPSEMARRKLDEQRQRQQHQQISPGFGQTPATFPSDRAAELREKLLKNKLLRQSEERKQQLSARDSLAFGETSGRGSESESQAPVVLGAGLRTVFGRGDSKQVPGGGFSFTFGQQDSGEQSQTHGFGFRAEPRVNPFAKQRASSLREEGPRGGVDDRDPRRFGTEKDTNQRAALDPFQQASFLKTVGQREPPKGPRADRNQNPFVTFGCSNPPGGVPSARASDSSQRARLPPQLPSEQNQPRRWSGTSDQSSQDHQVQYSGSGSQGTARPFTPRRQSEPETPSETSSLGAAQRRRSHGDKVGYFSDPVVPLSSRRSSVPSSGNPFINWPFVKAVARELADGYQPGLSQSRISGIFTKGQAYLAAQGIFGRPTTDTEAVEAVYDYFKTALQGGSIDNTRTDSFFNKHTPTGADPGELAVEVTDTAPDDEPVQQQPRFHAGSNMAPQFSSSTMTPNLGQFLNAINGFVKEQNDASLADFLVLEPPFNPTYQSMIAELQQAYPAGSEDVLEKKCAQSLTIASNGMNDSPSWTLFIKFMVQYLGYLRDVSADQSKYLETYELLYELQKRATSALGHSMGAVLLPTVISCARLICRLAIGLDKQPELIAHLKSNRVGGEDGRRQTLPERAAESIRQALTVCLNDRMSGLDNDGKPEGKKRGIYILANICLKIFFQCRKTRNAEMIFTTIRSTSPPLAAYPKRERVTYLYYLGRYWFQNNHFHRAQLALQEAYDESPASPQYIRQRRHILIYLVTSNIIMGRFPSQSIFQRPEAAGLQDRFLPLMLAIRSGNLAAFRQYLDLDGPHAPWFLHFRILLQLRNRCEVLVWRSLIRKVWILNGTRYDAGAKAAPLVNIDDLVCVFRALEKQVHKPTPIDPDFDPVDYEQHDDDQDPFPTNSSLESILSSLVDQGLLRGFIAHRQQKFVITGAKQTGGDVLAAGFPTPWSVIGQKTAGDENVPGWKKASAPNALGMLTGGLGGGMVVNLSGARAAGAA